MAGPGGVHAVEAFKDAFLVLGAESLALVRHGHGYQAVLGPHADAHPGVLRGVADGVVDQVAQRGHQQVLVAVDHRVRMAADHELDVLAFGRQLGPVHGLGDHGVDVHRPAPAGRRWRPAAGKFDDVLHQGGQPGGFLVHALGEPADGLRVIRGGLQRFGQQRDGPDRRLQFVGDVGDEVVADLLGAGDLGAVVGQQQDIFLRDHGRPDLDHDGSLAQRAARELQTVSEDDAVAPDLGRHFQQLLVHHGMAAHQAVGVGGRAGTDNAVDRVHHHEGPSDGGQHLGGALGKRGIVELDVHEFALLLADPEREHAEDAKRQADQAGDHADKHWIHGSSLCSAPRRKL